MRKLSQARKRFDGKKGKWELQHLWHNSPDSPITAVQGAEITLWRDGEYNPMKGLFEQFSVCG
jgi:hypothetical protein